MKKLLLNSLIFLGFIGPAYAAKNAGLALSYGFGSVAISAGLGFVLFILIKPKKDTEEKKAVYYGRLLLAYSLWASTTAVFPQFLIWPDINKFLLWLVPSIIFGFVAFIIGSAYGASKKTAVKLAKKTKTITKATIEKSVEKPIKKTVEEPQKKATEKNITKNENTMDEENSNEIDDEEFYLIATNEVEDENTNQALWAKCMAINMGDEKKSKYDYIKRRVSSLIIEAKEKKITDAKAAKTTEEKKIADDKAFREELYQSVTKEVKAGHFDYELYDKCITEYSYDGKQSKALYIDKRVEILFKEREEDKKLEVTKEQEVALVEKQENNYSKDGIKFKSKEDYEAYIRLHSNDKE